MKRPEWDVVVVGGGPAGSVTASLLAGEGRRVLLVDRARFPRDKACGESVNPGAVAELRSLGLLADVLKLPHRAIRGWKIHPLQGASFHGRLPEESPGIAVNRAEFDHLLFRAALSQGVQSMEGVVVSGLLREGSRISGVCTREGAEIPAGMVVGADGLRSVVTRRAGLVARSPRLRKVGLTAHVRGARVQEGQGELHLRRWGCVGIVAIDESTANVVVVANRARKGRGDAARWFDAVARDVPALAGAERITDVQTTGPFDYPMREVYGEGVLLVGDAAGYFDPFTGQGIYRALKGARMAAEACVSYLDSGNLGALKRYSLEHRDAFGPGVRLQKIVEMTVSRPILFGAAALVFHSAPALADLFVRMTGDVPPRNRALPS